MSEPIELKRKDLQTQVMQLRAQIVLLDQRLAALEAREQGPEFAPGRFQTMYEGDLLVIYGMATKGNTVPDVYFTHDRIRDVYSLHGYDGERPITIKHITTVQMRRLIGAAMAMLHRMESEGESRDSAE